jgi:hypothetical protein
LMTVSGLTKVAIFTTNVDAENQILINHKCVCGALNRHFCQPVLAVRCSLFQCSIRYSKIIFPCPISFLSVVVYNW